MTLDHVTLFYVKLIGLFVIMRQSYDAIPMPGLHVNVAEKSKGKLFESIFLIFLL